MSILLHEGVTVPTAPGLFPSQVEIHLDNERSFKDRIEWDLVDAGFTSEHYAASVSSHLGLDWRDARIIASNVEPLLKVLCNTCACMV
jgi:hypothetical protein